MPFGSEENLSDMIQISGLQAGMPIPPDVSEEIHVIPWSDWATVFPARGGRCQTSSIFEFLTLF